MRGAQRGSAEDFEALFALHWPRAYRTAWLVVHDAAAAEDIAQEAFIAALRRARQLRPPPPVRPVAEPDRRQPRDRLGARPAAAGGAGRVGRAGAAGGRRAGRRRSSPRCARCRSTSARSSSCATGSATRRARSPRMLDLPRGTVNSRLRRALDRLETLLEGEMRLARAAARPGEAAHGRERGCCGRRPARRPRASGRGVRIAAEFGSGRSPRRPRGRPSRSRSRRPRSRSSRRSARRATRSPTGSGPPSACGRTRPPGGVPAARPAASRRAPARLLRRHRRGSSRRTASGGGSARGRAPRGRRTGASRSSGATAGSPPSIAAGTCAGRCSRRGRSRTRCGRRAASASPTARARTCAWSPATAPATACSIPARSGRWPGGPARRTCSPTCRARTSTSSTSTPRRGSPASASPTSRRDRVVRRRPPAVRQPPPLARDLRRARPAHRPALDAAAADGLDVRPARSGSLVAVARRDARSSEVALMAPAAPPRAVPRRRALHPPALLPPAAAGCWSLAARRPVGLPAPGRDRRPRLLAAPGVRGAWRAGFPQVSGWCCPQPRTPS